MSDDLLAILTGGKDSLTPKVDPNVDAAIRTIYGEADGEPDAGKLAVAAVIRNRAQRTGKSIAEVVADPGAFTAWSDPKRRPVMEALDPSSEQYQTLAQLVGPALSGDLDPTNGADHYFAPKLQAANGAPVPDWAKGDGVTIGNHVFYNVGDQGGGPDELLGILSKDDRNRSPVVVAPLPPAKPNPENPALYPPEWQSHSEGHNFVRGLGRGVADVGDSLLNGMATINPNGPDKLGAVAVSERAARDAFDRDYGSSPLAIGGRLTGSTLATAPALAAGGELVAPALEMAGPAGQFIAGAYKGNKLLQLASRVGGGAARGATVGASAAALNSSASDEPLALQMGRGAATGAVIGGGVPATVEGVRLARNRLFPEPTVSQPVAELAQAAVDKYGMPLRTSQILGVGDRRMAITDSERLSHPGTGYPANNADQAKAFTQAVAKTFGEDADALTPEVMQRAKTRIGSEFDRVAKATTIADTTPLKNNLNGVIYDASQVLPASDLQPLQRQVENIQTAFRPDGSLSGESYQALTRKGSPLDVAANGPPGNIRDYAQKIRDVLDDALEASASPEDAQALSRARFQYKNLMTVKNLAAKANVEGEISPRLLSGAVNTSFKNRAFSGAGDLGELAQIGQTFMKEPPNSGTAPRLMARLSQAMPKVLGGAGLVDAGLALHDPGLALKLAGGAAAAAGVRGIGGVVNNALIRRANLRPEAVNRLLQASLSPSGAPSVVVVPPAARAVLSSLNDNVALPAGVITANRLLSSRPSGR